MKVLLINTREHIKLKLSFAFFLFLFLVTTAAFSQIGIGTTLPNGALDITSTTQGVVIPRIALTANNVMAPVTNPNGGTLLDGTMVYNTAASGSGSTAVLPGFYYWESSKWQYIKKDLYSFNVYGLFTSSVAQTLTNSTGEKVVFGTTLATGGLITYDTTNRDFTLPAGKTYRVDFTIPWIQFAANANYLRFALYDDTANTKLSASAHCETVSNTAALAYSSNFTHFLTVGSSPLIISVRTVGGNITSATLGDVTVTTLPTISIRSID
jgi:hypothetical protein